VTLEGEYREWRRIGDEGGACDFRFCPTCGSTVWYTISAAPETIAVALGAFADPSFPPPVYSVYEDRRHAWITLPDSIERHA
jgi:hypothetical protein